MTSGERVAFLTPEFATESRQGGVGSYVETMCNALASAGYRPLVVVPADRTESLRYANYTVERVDTRLVGLVALAYRAIHKAQGPRLAEFLINCISARRLAKRIASLNKNYRLRAVQFPNYQLLGIFLSRGAGYRLLMRLSTSRCLWDQTNGLFVGKVEKITEWLDVRCARKADVVYAPSNFLATYFQDKHGLDVKVVRPPPPEFLGAASQENDLSNQDGLSGCALPARFYFHFGSLSRRKGTEAVFGAMRWALKRNPTIRLVVAGAPKESIYLTALLERFPDVAWNTVVLGRLGRQQVMTVLRRCEAAVLPSMADNLPNTAIEALSARCPVIAFNGASLDELIRPGYTGILCEFGNVEALGNTLLQNWSHPIRWRLPGRRAGGDGFGGALDLAKGVRDFLNLIEGS